jgi:hypothetical protein
MSDDNETGWAKIEFCQSVDDLIQHGPSIDIGIGPSPYLGTGQIRVRAQIDTGAVCSGLRPGLAQKLGLSNVGTAIARIAGLAPIETPLYAAMFFMPFGDIDLNVIDVGSMDAYHGALIGRDILGNCRLNIDFLSGVTTLHIKAS